MDFSKTRLVAVLFSIFLFSKTIQGFSVEFIHRDSPKSPFFDPALNATQRLINSLLTSVSLVDSLTTILSDDKHGKPFSDITFGSWSYLMKILVGTPPVEIIAIVDTGSDLIWTQCKPCTDCFEQKFPIFNPENSTSYNDVSCRSKQCKLLQLTDCSRNGSCVYGYDYGDGSSTVGHIAEETIALPSTSGEPISFPKTIFGCGHNNQGTFESATTGIVGLGTGPISLISQMGETAGGRFSHCLVPNLSGSDKSSKLSFGEDAIVSGEGVVSTPLFFAKNSTYYYLRLVGVSVGRNIINVAPSALESGNIIIDSGTTLTTLPGNIYPQVESAVAATIPLLPKSQDLYPGMTLCYKTNNTDIKVPDITVHFEGGADLKLSSTNAFFKVMDDLCLALGSANGGEAIYGNLAQVNFLVGYDMVRKVVAFKPTDCAS